jgi:NAD(P)-dependent dehydrogenase (short-subunit alcohol dehydrogenase family)
MMQDQVRDARGGTTAAVVPARAEAARRPAAGWGEAALADARIVVVGGSSGMGRAVATAALARGARVTLVGRDAGRLDAAAAAMTASLAAPVEVAGGNAGASDGASGVTSAATRVRTAVADARDEAQVRALFAALAADGPLDHLVVSAGELTAGVGPLLGLDTAAARAQFESRFWGPYLVARYGAPALAPAGSLTFFTGIYGEKPVAGASVPSAVHGALERLARVLAVELAPRRVNVVSPGTTDTPLHGWMSEADRAAFFAEAAARTPGGRVGTADDVARAVLYLLESPRATGTVLRVDGGEALV